jgi:DNA topoisomerase I
MSTIIISEKNKAAQAIAEALGPVNVIKKDKYLNIYHVKNQNVFVIPLRGHILEYRNTKAFESWTSSNPRDIITNPNAIKKYPIKNTNSHISALKEYSKQANHCIIGTDADIEGCNIGLIDALNFIKKTNQNIKVSQLWLSSLQKNEILTKMNSLVSPKYSWADSGEARAIIDAFIGFSATRQATKTFKPLLNKYNVKFTSIGRVQTSLLYLIYLKEKEIDEFVPKLYFIIEANLIHSQGTFKASHEKNPFLKEEELKALKIYNKIKNEQIANIIENKTDIGFKFPPAPLNTSKALILLTKTLKISAKVALSAMNSLYLNKLITYPRTDSDIYKSDFNHDLILQKLATHSLYGTYTVNLLKTKQLKPTKGKIDAGDHPPITPLESVELSSAKFDNGVQKKVYDILTRHYLALFGERASESIQKLKLEIKDEPFKAQTVVLVSVGFYAIAPFLKPNYDKLIQIHGSTIPIKNVEFNNKQTKPPPRYTDTSLLKLMEANHLGTKSTRPQIIQILSYRKNIRRIKRNYAITELGAFIIENLISIWLPFLKPDFTKEVEKKLEEIKDQKRSMHQVVNEVRKEFLELFDKFLQAKIKISSSIKEYNIKNMGTQKTTNKFDKLTSAKCPKCNNHPMKFINLKNKRFLVCSDDTCKTFLSLPKRGKLRLLNSTCKLCGFNVFKVDLKQRGKSFIYYLCPLCWNRGLKDKNGSGFCSNCKDYTILNDDCIKR